MEINQPGFKITLGVYDNKIVANVICLLIIKLMYVIFSTVNFNLTWENVQHKMWIWGCSVERIYWVDICNTESYDL